MPFFSRIPLFSSPPPSPPMATMGSVITIDGIDYDADARAAAYFNALDQLTIHLDDAYDELVWTIVGVDPVPPFINGREVLFTVDGTLRFRGDITRVTHAQSQVGWAIHFVALGLRNRADQVTIRSSDGSGNAVYNRPSTDPEYIPTNSGLTVGTIIRRILTIPENAADLNAHGIGAYVSTTPYTLPTFTLSDLGALDVVPPSQVLLSGEHLFSELDQLVKHWHPKYTLWIDPSNGVIRCFNLLTMSANLLTIPGESSISDEAVSWPQVSRETGGCYTAFQVIGRNIKAAVCSEIDLTLKRSWDPAYDATWTLEDFTQPKDAVDEGAITTLTTTNAVVDPTDATHHWSANFWNDPSREGVIIFYFPGGTGINIMDSRVVTSCTALSAGGTGTVTWDASEPLDSLSYTKYKLIARAGPRVDVGRRFAFSDAAGNTGLDTWIGAHLVKRFPKAVPFATNSTAVKTSVPIGVVLWSSSGAAPLNEYPITFEIIPSTGEILLTEPIWKPFTTVAALNAGIPSTYATGKYVDLKIMVPYNRGDLTVRKPASGFEGLAYTQDGIQAVKTIALDAFTYALDSINIAKLAQEHLDVLKDPITAGSIISHGKPSAFDPLAFPYSLTLRISGATSQWDTLNLPVRSVTMNWPQQSGDLQTFSYNFSNLRRPFQGDDLYVHPLSTDEGQGGGQLPFGEPGSNPFTPGGQNIVQYGPKDSNMITTANPWAMGFNASPTAPQTSRGDTPNPNFDMPKADEGEAGRPQSSALRERNERLAQPAREAAAEKEAARFDAVTDERARRDAAKQPARDAQAAAEATQSEQLHEANLPRAIDRQQAKDDAEAKADARYQDQQRDQERRDAESADYDRTKNREP